MIDPVPELARAEGRLADLAHHLGQFLAREADQVAARVFRRRRCLEQGRVVLRAHCWQAFTVAA
jgi:hypothetical protein